MNPSYFSRRQWLQWSGWTGLGLLLNSCGLDELSSKVGNASEPLNQHIEEWLQNPQVLAPEYPLSAIDPQALLVNSFNENEPEIDLDTYALIVDGAVAQPQKLSITALQSMPRQSMVIRHVCVEGWTAIVQWGGVRLSDVLALAQPHSSARYVNFISADGYYCSWDLASARHPQTLMAYQMNGQPLPEENGAPLRLAAPIKLGYKQSKWVTKIEVLNHLPAQKGYWEDQGYEWFAGL
jgi:DMSO/TMAO reductase YedYZ molybdopterin-dependent catalytic subunit